jgi:hypothetical protein
MANHIITRRCRYTLFGLETLGVSIFSAYWLCKHYGWDWIIWVAIFLFCSFGIGCCSVISGYYVTSFQLDFQCYGDC